jgi:hypothetical protein
MVCSVAVGSEIESQLRSVIEIIAGAPSKVYSRSRRASEGVGMKDGNSNLTGWPLFSILFSKKGIYTFIAIDSAQNTVVV